MKIKCNANFRLETRYDKSTGELISENVPIIMFFSFDGKQLRYYTGYRIDRDKWNNDTQKVNINVVNRNGITASTINNRLKEVENTITEIYYEQKVLKKNPSVQYMRNELKNRLGEGKNKSTDLSFFDVFNLFIEQESQVNTWTKGTITKINTILSQLKEFHDRNYKLDFDSIDETFLQRYLKYQLDDLDLRNTTISKNFRIFKWFMNWATRKGYNQNLSYRDFNLSLKGTVRNKKIIFLTWEELIHLYELSIPKTYLRQVRDVFCFCCFTGLRYSDVYNLKKNDIKKDVIEVTTIKTEDSLQIDLNDYSRAILSKYKDIPFPDGKALPVISNQKFNEYLKELGEFAELNDEETIVYYKGNERKEETYKKWELLTSHTGRRTFISNALFFNIPAEVIMSWTGHKDHKVMENYYKIISSHKQREMTKFNKNNNSE